MDSLRRTVASFLTAVFLVSAFAAQAQTPEVGLHAFALKYRRADEAVALVSPLLSRDGTVELQPGSNTLVIRDTAVALARIIPVLRSFDHPARPLTLELYIVRASRSQVSPAVPRSDLPDSLTQRLRSLLTYDIYEVQAQAQLASFEGQAVTYALADDYKVSFRLGTLFGDQRVKLSDFRIVRRTDRRTPGAALIHTNLNLRLDQTLSLGLARSEASREALMVVMILHNGEAGRRLQRAEQ